MGRRGDEASHLTSQQIFRAIAEEYHGDDRVEQRSDQSLIDHRISVFQQGIEEREEVPGQRGGELPSRLLFGARHAILPIQSEPPE